MELLDLKAMFTPIESAVGAILIHISTTSFLAETGRTIGFSSTIHNAVFHPSLYACSVVAGVLSSGFYVGKFLPEFVPQYPRLEYPIYLVAGLLTGVGTAWGSGCTSGHMLAGVSLLRIRSMVATLIFCLTAAFVVNFWDLAPSCSGSCYVYDPAFTLPRIYKSELMALVLFAYVSSFLVLPQLGERNYVRVLVGLNAGFQFGLGLLVSGMASPNKPIGFLSVYHIDKFDPSLAMIVVFAIIPNVFRWRHYLATHSRPILESKYALSNPAAPIRPKMLAGNMLFGVGWGFMGICPGPGLLGAVFNGLAGVSWLGAFLIAYRLATLLTA